MKVGEYMNLEEVIKVLNDIYKEPLQYEKKRHIVFWYDAEGEFLEDIDTLELENVRLLKLTNNNYFYIRYELEKVDTTSNILIYANMEKPSPRENWLLDIYKYSVEFSTDKTTVMMRDLNIKDPSLKPVLKKYSKFFSNKERYAAFKRFYMEEYTEDNIHIAVLSVLCKLSIPNFEEVTKVLLKEYLSEDKRYKDNIEKFGDMNAFWDLASKYYGYNLEEKTIGKLMILLSITDFDDKVNKELPKSYTNYISNKKSNCVIFINHFMNNREDAIYYKKLSDKVAEAIKLESSLAKWNDEDFIECDTFRYFDKRVINKLTDLLISGASEFEKYKNTINKRKSLNWYLDYKNYYEAIEEAIELFRIKNDLESIKEKSPYEMMEAYYNNGDMSYYLIDKAYRKFYTAYDKINNKDVLYSLMEKVEDTYTNWYLDDLSIKWSTSIKTDLKATWNIPGVISQKNFYSNFIEPHSLKNERVFVIISDALRYDCAKELCDDLNIERKGTATIDVLQGVLPSYTKLGMASLLPYKNISLNDNNEVYIDEVSAEGTENRNKILKSKNNDSIAVTYKEIENLHISEYRSLFSGKKVIYIYHNVIDARGDNASTEREVFDAVEDTFVELKQLINNLVIRLKASNIYITSDHGFLYRRGIIKTTESLKFDTDEKYGRRYAISNNYEEKQGTLTFSMDYILGENSNKYVTVPRGEVRFAKQGAGCNYVHGGSMLQEIVIPVIKFKNSKGEGKNINNHVEVEMTTISKKITTPRFSINFFQKEKVEDKKLPLILKAYFEDSEGNIISNELSIFADSKSSNAEDRIYKERFSLKSITYNKNAKYYLVLVEDESEIKNEYARYEFIIDIAIQDDFGF
ncbi:MAG: BREX-1 system phosphatase PglZ type A [Romboutsia timonensis]|uniref:BREX-1 system phosphatase PglZ type A n=1 Tax=Romboutsia timonensis TaxID=1776391 RepID=UPI002A76098F|nr:BREX-1 system phosphatase PglZ type A [Romboutsia timonensis]MDY2883579.1 BREX-1 system phosphatase PglZ type A [Romboutsia timonensis]